ncbi:unnamed protein product [Symbiodinium sp. CCMP2592]|nr:unnamed protein product [Symbiodinium sp. CCMP2592]
MAPRALTQNDSVGSDDWYDACQQKQQPAVLDEKPSLPVWSRSPKRGLQTQESIAEKKQRVAASAWKDWTQPTPGREELKADKTTPKKPTEKNFQQQQQMLLNRQAIAASVAAQKAAQAAEASIKLASFATHQVDKAKTAAGQSQAALKKQPPTTPPKPQQPSSTAASNGNDGEDNPVAEDEKQAATDENTSDAKKGNLGKGQKSAGNKPAKLTPDESTSEPLTFGGRKVPNGNDAAEVFNLKKKLFYETREELQKKFPGKSIHSGATGSQDSYCKHVKDHMDKVKKQKQGKKMTQDEVREQIKEAARLWKEKLSKNIDKSKA